VQKSFNHRKHSFSPNLSKNLSKSYLNQEKNGMFLHLNNKLQPNNLFHRLYHNKRSLKMFLYLNLAMISLYNSLNLNKLHIFHKHFNLHQNKVMLHHNGESLPQPNLNKNLNKLNCYQLTSSLK